MDLVENLLKAIHVPGSVPPIKDERSDKPAKQSLDERHVPRRQFE